MFFEILADVLNDFGRHFKFSLQGFGNFIQDWFAKHDLLLIKAQFKYRVTKSLGSERRYKNVCVQDNLHEMLLKTSSSVRIPRASANGSMVFLKRLKL